MAEEEQPERKKGRRKIPIVKIQKGEDRLITFSKRRSGIYKKSSEISTLCDAEVGVLVFSPAGKPFSFGCPDIDSVVKRMENGGVRNQDLSMAEVLSRQRVENLNQSCDDLSVEMKKLKKEGDQLTKERKERLKEDGGNKKRWWWEVPVDDLNAAEMRQMIHTMETMNRSATHRNQDLRAAAAAMAARGGDGASCSPGGIGEEDEAGPFTDPGAYGYGYDGA